MNPHKLLLAVAFFLQATLAYAGCSVGGLPFNLQNNTLADATQVMANFNQITTGVNSNCAAAGANDDITSLSALTTPITPSQGGTPLFTNGADTGSANARTNTVTSNFTLTGGYHLSAISSFTNTATVTMSVNGGAAVQVYRKTQFGTSPTVGGELIAGHPYELIYYAVPGVWLLTGETIVVGEMKMIMYGSAPFQAPPGYFIADGSTFVCATYLDLCTIINTSYGGTSSNPALPDTRGRVLAAVDSYGTSTGAAGRLTSAATGCGSTFDNIGSIGSCANASQSHTQIGAELAQHGHTATSTTTGTGSGNVTDPGHVHAQNASTYYNLAGTNLTTGGTVSIAQSAANTVSNTTGVTVPSLNLSLSTSTSISLSGSSQAMPIVNPNLATVMIIRF